MVKRLSARADLPRSSRDEVEWRRVGFRSGKFMAPKTQIDLPASQIADLCQRYQVRELALFGSMLRDDYHPGSDVDVLVSFVPGSHQSVLELAAMRRELEAILGRRVDLVDRRVIEESSNYI